ncbi:MAG TPA: hypothetical protein VFO16_13395 [Pseudonocardiaceae bacterium]|nr:hypothetical protein [Pseudonocardiaceae bacterium]
MTDPPADEPEPADNALPHTAESLPESRCQHPVAAASITLATR